MPNIAVQLLVGQNEEPFLRYAIRSVSWADYFTVCNTSPESEFGKLNEQIVHDECPSEKLRLAHLHPGSDGHFSFADARNSCLKLTDRNDLVLILDADDVHFPELEEIVRDAAWKYVDSITAMFFHLMVYKNIYQYTQPREIVYKNDSGTHWEKGVHEQLINVKRNPVNTLYHYMHYGYVKPQRQIFDRWKFYSDLEGDIHHYDGQDPENIVSDRISVCKPLPVEHPAVIQEYIKDMPEFPLDKLRASPPPSGAWGEEAIGLVLLTYNDEEYLEACLSTLNQTNTNKTIEFEVLAIDCNSTDKSRDKLFEWADKGSFELNVVQSEEYTSLAEALNYGFDHFRMQEKFRYVGWIHPDMEFVQENWLYNLWQELQDHEEIGKICSANFRDQMPDQLIAAQEQCFILRKDILHKIGLFDEGYVGIGGYEDWDMNRRIMLHSGPAGHYKVMVTPISWCFHKGMGTRSKRNTTDQQIANARHYFDKWHTHEPPV